MTLADGENTLGIATPPAGCTAIGNPTAPATAPPRRLRQLVLHLCRWGLLAAIILLIRQQHVWYQAQTQGQQLAAVTLADIHAFFPDAAGLADWRPEQGGQNVVDAAGQVLGYVVQTSPAADAVIGYSGPTNTLIAFDREHRILGLRILRCGDTPEHLAAILADPQFLQAFHGLTWDEAQRRQRVDAVSGATLTSLAIVEGIVRRLGGDPHSYRFPEPLSMEDAQRFFPAAVQIQPRREQPALYEVCDAAGQRVGSIARTSPVSDDMIGFQGPTDTLLALDPHDRVLGIAIRKSYETDSYVVWVEDDRHFLNCFNGQSLEQLAGLDLREAGVEGVSGATMTSLAIAQALVATAQRLRAAPPQPPRPRLVIAVRDVGTVLITLAGVLLSFSALRGKRLLRIGFQVLVIAYLGFLNGDMLSQALAVGWAQSGVAWRSAPGLVVLAVAALLVPLATRKQAYCHHLCPHGAAQQLLIHIGRRHTHLPPWLARGLQALPAALLAVTLVVALRHLPFSLTAIEPFDAYLFRIAGWGTLAVAVAGLAAALVIPMAYCRFGCPTGAVLNYLRFNSHSDRLTVRDFAALVLLALALGLWLAR